MTIDRGMVSQENGDEALHCEGRACLYMKSVCDNARCGRTNTATQPKSLLSEDANLCPRRFRHRFFVGPVLAVLVITAYRSRSPSRRPLHVRVDTRPIQERSL